MLPSSGPRPPIQASLQPIFHRTRTTGTTLQMQNLPDQTLSDHTLLCHRQGEITTLKIVGEVGMADLLQFFGRYYAGSPTRYMAVEVSAAPVTRFSAAEAESLNSQLANMPNM